MADKIVRDQPDLAVIGLQEDCIYGSTIIEQVAQLLADKYTLLESVTVSGWGVTTVKALTSEWRYRPRGLRLAVFQAVNSTITISAVETNWAPSPGLRDWLTCGKGCAAITLDTSAGKLAFINVHLPFYSKTLPRDQTIESRLIRHKSALWQAYCLKKLYSGVVQSDATAFVFGDLNFRCQGDALEVFKLVEHGQIDELLQNHDELTLLRGYSSGTENPEILPNLQEAPITFLPTCKLRHTRNLDDPPIKWYRRGRSEHPHRTPSWCDRILFSSGVKCSEYDRWDMPGMANSDHAAVIGIYKLSSK
jgi:hypothetical protein